MVAINRGRVSCVAAPFGGLKRSGYGNSGGSEGIDECLVTRYLTLPELRVAAPAPEADVLALSARVWRAEATRRRKGVGHYRR